MSIPEENKLKKQIIIGAEEEEGFCRLSGQSSELAVALIKNTISRRYATRIAHYDKKDNSVSNIFVDYHRLGTNPGSFKGASKEECSKKFKIIEEVFLNNKDLSHEVQSLQKELEEQKSKNSQLSQQLIKYDYEENSTPTISQEFDGLQGSSSEGEIERFLKNHKKQVFLGTETEKDFCHLSMQSNELAVVLIKNTISRSYAVRIVNYERKSGSVSNIFVESHRLGVNPGSIRGASKDECTKKFEIIKGVFSTNKDLTCRVQSLHEELEVLKSKNGQLSKQLMKYRHRNILIIGEERAGKSTLTKLLSEYNKKSKGKDIESEEFVKNFINYKAIDTAGLKKLKKVNKRNKFKKGLNQVFFVINYEKKLFNGEDLIELFSLFNLLIFDKDIREYITIIVTNSEEIKNEQQVQREIIHEATQEKNKRLFGSIDRDRIIFIKNPPLGKGCEEKCIEMCRNVECSKNRIERENSLKKLLEHLEVKYQKKYCNLRIEDSKYRKNEIIERMASTTSTTKWMAKAIKQMAKVVADAAKSVAEIAKSVAEIAKSVAEIVKSVAEVAKSVAEVAKLVAGVAKLVTGLAKSVTGVAKSMNFNYCSFALVHVYIIK